MKYTIALAALAAVAVEAQTPAKAPAAGKCQKTTAIKPPSDPMILFEPGVAVFPCDFGAAIPLGKVPTGCAKLEVIYARGTSEPGNLGMVVGDPLVARLKRDLPGVNVRGYPVQYPASMAGSATGVSDIPKRIQQQAKECPDEKFVLSGYSQGGMVVSSALSKIPAELREKVIAVVLYGAGDSSGTNAAFKAKTMANCAPGDFACPKSGSGPGHVSYNNVGTKWHDRSAQYVAAAYNGKGMGNKLMRDPTAALQK